MSALTPVLATYSTLELTAMMTSALVVALLVIALAFRIVRAIVAVREYEQACEKVAQIEQKLKDMQEYTTSLEQQFAQDLNDASQEHAKERFELEQLIFARNSEILSLKNTLIEMSQSRLEENV